MPNLHFYPIGLGFENGETTFTTKSGYKEDIFKVRKLDYLIQGWSKIPMTNKMAFENPMYYNRYNVIFL